ncbi:MAG TPA: right-handed parallel beta-helix repeat-containing protein, partial [Methylomirabilota bacterium]|nr:right-handed parallel beta-helix repeat-containing protein [Methylomirabilota bacterium]
MKFSAMMLVSAGLLMAAQTEAVEVQNTNDSGPGSLRQAVLDAPAGDTITFAPELSGQAIKLTSGSIVIDKNLTFVGPGASKLKIQRDSELSFRLFFVVNSSQISFSGLTFANGSETLGGSAVRTTAGSRLEVRGCVFSDNFNWYAGAILSNGELLVDGCSFVNNRVRNEGGAIFAVGGVVRNSTFYANEGRSGAAIFSTGSMAVDHCTFVGHDTNPNDPTILNRGALQISNSIFANSVAPGIRNSDFSTFTPTGVNFCTTEPVQGFITVPLTGEGGLNLAALALNRGETPTFALLENSVAIDAAVNSTIGVDQIGTRRPFGAANDAGA